MKNQNWTKTKQIRPELKQLNLYFMDSTVSIKETNLAAAATESRLRHISGCWTLMIQKWNSNDNIKMFFDGRKIKYDQCTMWAGVRKLIWWSKNRVPVCRISQLEDEITLKFERLYQYFQQFKSQMLYFIHCAMWVEVRL